MARSPVSRARRGSLIEIRKGAECSVHRVTTRPADRMPDRDRAPARDVVRPGGNTVALWA